MSGFGSEASSFLVSFVFAAVVLVILAFRVVFLFGSLPSLFLSSSTLFSSQLSFPPSSHFPLSLPRFRKWLGWHAFR